MNGKKNTDFGYRRVPAEEKSRLVGEVFSKVAENYDLMNDLMSLGLHRVWKKIAARMAKVKEGDAVLDLAGGTGDMSALLAPRAGEKARFVLADINEKMLRLGREKLANRGLVHVRPVRADAQALPFADNSFDHVCIAFGLRNVTDKALVLSESWRVLKVGGQIVVLEFSKPTNAALQKLYDAYSFGVLPLLGKAVAKSGESYRYLAESIRMHPDQKKLRTMMEEAGFGRCYWQNLSAGIVAIHYGRRLC